MQTPLDTPTSALVAFQCDCDHYVRLSEYLPQKFGSVRPRDIEFKLKKIPTPGPRAPIAEHKQELVFLDVDNLHQLLYDLNNSPHLYRYICRLLICTGMSENLDFLASLERETEKVYRVQVFPNTSLKPVVDAIPESVKLHPKQFTDILSVIYANGLYYHGTVDRSLFYNQDNVYKPGNKISRAYYKMKEIIERVDCLPIQKHWKVADVGAAPGGWTQCLSPIVREIVCIDPADLRIEVPTNVTYHKMKSQDYPLYLRKQLQLTEEEQLPQSFDLITSDINETPQIVLDYLDPIMPLVKPNGYLVMTLKFPKRRQDNLLVKVEEFKGDFHAKFPGWEMIHTVWLLANYNERTIVAVKKS